MRYRSKPQVIEAVQWTGNNYDAVRAFAGMTVISVGGLLPLRLLAGKNGAQGWVPVPAGHWIVRAADDPSDHWPVDPAYFDAKYAPEP